MAASDALTRTAALARRLLDPACYPHPVRDPHLVETHISFVILTGDFAYKIKKPVDLGFLDFSTLERRRFFCAEELRLNRRLAPDLYLDVVPVAGTAEQPRIGGAGDAREYAVRMRQFPEAMLADRVQARGEFLPHHVDALAARIAAFHAACDRADPRGSHGTPERVMEPVRENFAQVLERIADPQLKGRVEGLGAWVEMESFRLAPVFAARLRDGFVRECHGDLHLGNLFIEGDSVQVFDCIEFNPELRWIDVASEVAFLFMDLVHRRHADLARRFLDDWLARTGDFGALAPLRFYLAYRAMARAKVAAIRAAQEAAAAEERDAAMADCVAHVALAEGFSRAPKPWLVATCGPSGCGKSQLTRALIERRDAVRVRSDVERKRLFGLAPEARSAPGNGLYGEDATRRAYARLRELAGQVLDAGWPVAVDAACLARWQRDLFRSLAGERRVPFVLAAFDVPLETLRLNVAERARKGLDPSEATVAVLERQMATLEPIWQDEAADCITVPANPAEGLPLVLRGLPAEP